MKKRKNEFEVVYLDDNEIVLEEDKRKLVPFSWFFFKYGRLITMIFASIATLCFVGGIALSLSNISQVTPPIVDNQGVIMQFDGSDNVLNTPYNAITSDYAESLFKNRINGTPLKDKYINVIDVIVVGNDKILIFENGSAVIIYGDKDKLPIYIPNKDNVKVDNGKIVLSGDIIKVIDKNTLPDGTIIYEFENEMVLVEKNDEYYLIKKEDIVYDKNGNILEEDATNDIVDTINVGNDKILIFENGSAVVIYGDKNKLPVYIPNKDNVKAENGKIVISGDIVKTIDKDVLPDSTIVYEFSNDKLLIEKNDEYKLVDKNRGEEIARAKVGKDTIIYFDNGSAVIIKDNKLPEYVENRDDVIVENGKIKVKTDTVKTDNKKELPDSTIIYEFKNDKVLVEKNGKYKLVDKVDIVYDENGNIIVKNDDMNFTDFTITNNTENEVLKYRVVLEEAQNYGKYGKERLLPEYINYKLSINNELQPSSVLNKNVWKKGSTIEGDLKVTNNTYILYEGEVKKYATDKFTLGLWLDYHTIGNSMQDKWFIGTIKVYAWME